MLRLSLRFIFFIFVFPFFIFSPYPAYSADTDVVSIPTMTSVDPVIATMFAQSVETALEAIKTAKDGTRYLSAGPKYTAPERTYYRDSYWTSGLLLFIDPPVVREQVLRLALGIERDGSAPSAISVDANNLKVPLWIDHHDSGPYFIMMIYDYLRYTGDKTLLDQSVNGRRVLLLMEDVLTHLQSLDSDGNGLPQKPKNSLQDWLDSIPRGGEVFYNQVLYYRALRNIVEILELRGDAAHATLFHRQSLLVRHQLNTVFWNEAKGYYYERCENNVCVDRLTNESSLAILYDVIAPENRKRFFLSLKKLETPWGVVNAFPAYEGTRAGRYQNVTDWPVLDGFNAGARLKYGNNNWMHSMTRWWTYFNQIKKDGEKLPEFIAPTDFNGGRSQAWSVNPIVSFLRYGLGLDPSLDGTYTLKPSPVGTTTLKQIWMRGAKISI